MKYMAVFAALVLCFVGHDEQQNSQEPDLSSHRVAAVAVSYSQENRLGQILLSDSEDRFEHYFDIWGKSRNDASPVDPPQRSTKGTKLAEMLLCLFVAATVLRQSPDVSTKAGLPDLQ